MPPKARSQTVPLPPAVTAPAGDEGDLPEGWAVAKLGECSDLNPRHPSNIDDATPVTFVAMPSVRESSPDIDTSTVRPLSEVRKGYTHFADGDVLFAKITPCMENGKGAVAHGLMSGIGCGSTELHVIRPKGVIDPYFAYRFLQQESVRRLAAENFTGSAGQLRVPTSFVAELPIPLPPLAEQRRIVGVLEGLLGKVAASRERLARVPQLLKRFRQSVLAAACSGKLTNDWREENEDGESADILRERINKLRLAAWKEQRESKGQSARDADYVTPMPPSEEFDFEWPDGWLKCSMDELTSIITSGSRDWKQYYRTNGCGTFIMAQNIRPLWLDRSYRLAVAPPDNDRDRVRSEVRKGDLLVTIVGANTGDVCRVPEELDQHYVCQSVALMRPVVEETSRFLELCLNSSGHGLAQYQKWIYGEGRPHLSFDNLRETAVPLPPLAEQHEIVRRVEQLFALADRLEAQLAAARTRVDRLTQAILAKAFRGELVPTEADLARRESRLYEPARELLARIRELQTTTKPTKAPRKPRQKTGE